MQRWWSEETLSETLKNFNVSCIWSSLEIRIVTSLCFSCQLSVLKCTGSVFPRLSLRQSLRCSSCSRSRHKVSYNISSVSKRRDVETQTSTGRHKPTLSAILKQWGWSVGFKFHTTISVIHEAEALRRWNTKSFYQNTDSLNLIAFVRSIFINPGPHQSRCYCQMVEMEMDLEWWWSGSAWWAERESVEPQRLSFINHHWRASLLWC